MAKNVKHYYKQNEDKLGKAIDDSATSLSNVVGGLVGGLFSAAADSIKECLFKEDENEQ
jgi:hypothetical protein